MVKENWLKQDKRVEGMKKVEEQEKIMKKEGIGQIKKVQLDKVHKEEEEYKGFRR